MHVNYERIVSAAERAVWGLQHRVAARGNLGKLLKELGLEGQARAIDGVIDDLARQAVEQVLDLDADWWDYTDGKDTKVDGWLQVDARPSGDPREEESFEVPFEARVPRWMVWGAQMPLSKKDIWTAFKKIGAKELVDHDDYLEVVYEVWLADVRSYVARRTPSVALQEFVREYIYDNTYIEHEYHRDGTERSESFEARSAIQVGLGEPEITVDEKHTKREPGEFNLSLDVYFPIEVDTYEGSGGRAPMRPSWSKWRPEP